MYGIIAASGEPDSKFFSLIETKPTAAIDVTKPFERTDLSIIKTQLQNGDLMRVFNSIVDGQEILQVTVDLELDRKEYQTYQTGVDRGLWVSLFNLALPAKLQKPDGTTIDGNLMGFSETGMEGRTDWVLFDFNKKGYESTHWLKKDDILTVFSRVTNGNIEWQGRLEFKNEELTTGKEIMLVSFDENAGDDESIRSSFKTRSVQEKYIKTPVNPNLKSWEEFSLYNRPAMIVR